MFARILVPLDGSPQSNIALPLARTMAQATGASIVLLRVLIESTPAEDQTLARDADEALAGVARELAASGVSVDSTVRLGEPAKEILEQARAQHADLIIMRIHGRVGVERAVLGSVSAHVLIHSHVPVMTLRPGGRRVSQLSSLLVPVDGSPRSSVALAAAVGLATVTGARIHLLQVVVPMSAETSTWFSGMAYYDPGWDQEALASAREYVNGLVYRLAERGTVADGEVRMVADVAGSIVDAAEQVNADAIVMATRARTGVARAVLGSVADAVARTAHCPALLIHSASGAEGEQS